MMMIMIPHDQTFVRGSHRANTATCVNKQHCVFQVPTLRSKKTFSSSHSSHGVFERNNHPWHTVSFTILFLQTR